MRTWTIRDIPILSIHIAQKRSDWPCGEGIAQWEREFDSQASVGTALPRLAEARITATVITRLNPGAFPGPLLPLVIAVDLRHFLPGQFGRREGRWAGGIEDSDRSPMAGSRSFWSSFCPLAEPQQMGVRDGFLLGPLKPRGKDLLSPRVCGVVGGLDEKGV